MYPARWTQTELMQVFVWNKGVFVTYAFAHVHTVKCGEKCSCSNVKSMQREGRMNGKCLVPAIDFQSPQMEVYPVDLSHNQPFNINFKHTGECLTNCENNILGDKGHCTII